MKSQRLLEILLRLQSRSPRSAGELARDLKVNQRTIYRDIDALGAAGIPLFTTRGVKGGIHLLEGYRQSINSLSDAELRAVFVGGHDPLSDLGWGDQLQPAREKLFGALSDRQRVGAMKSKSRILVESRQWMQSVQPTKILTALRVAIWNERQVEIRYRNQSGKSARSRLNPLGLVFKAGIWYLVAQNGERILTYRASRISKIETLPLIFERPTDFDIADHWERSTQRYEATARPILVRVAGQVEHLKKIAVVWPTRLHRGGLGNRTADVTFPLRGVAVHELLAWSAELEVVEPTDIRTEIKQRLQTAIRHYRK